MGRGQAEQFLMELLGEGEDRTWKTYQRHLGEFTPRAEWADLAETTLKRVGATPVQQISEAERTAESTVEKLQETISGKQKLLDEVWSVANRKKVLEPVETTGEWLFGKAERWVSPARLFSSRKHGYEMDIARTMVGTKGRGDTETYDMLREHLKEREAYEQQLITEIQELKELQRRATEANESQAEDSRTPTPTAVQENRNQHGENGRLSFWEAGLGFGISSR
jgi:hypothetical protein